MSWNLVQDAPRLHYSVLLLLQCATLGIFCALDTLLFFFFWELTLLPIYFLLARWGVTAGSARVAARYFLIMLAGGVPLLIAFVLLATSQSVPTFDLLALQAVPLPRSTQLAFFLLCLIGFGVKVPLVPLHTWLPQFALAAPGSLTALLVGLKLGAYGLLRFAIPLAPAAAQDLHWLLAGLGTLTLIYGAVGMGMPDIWWREGAGLAGQRLPSTCQPANVSATPLKRWLSGAIQEVAVEFFSCQVTAFSAPAGEEVWVRATCSCHSQVMDESSVRMKSQKSCSPPGGTEPAPIQPTQAVRCPLVPMCEYCACA